MIENLIECNVNAGGNYLSSQRESTIDSKRENFYQSQQRGTNFNYNKLD